MPTVLKYGSLNLLEPSGRVKACNRIALLHVLYVCIHTIICPMDIAIYHYLFPFFVSHFYYLILIAYLSPFLYVPFSLPRFFHFRNFLSAYILYFGSYINVISLPCSVPFCDCPFSVTPYITFSQSLVRTLRFPFLILCAPRPRITKLFSKME